MPSRPEASRVLRRLLVWAFLVRVAVGVFVAGLNLDDLFAPDHRTYHYFADWLARYWAGDTLAYPWKLLDKGPKAYYYIVAAVYYALGSAEFLPKALNVALGTMSVALCFEIALGLDAGERAALRAARFTAYFPSLVLWSTLNIRDSWVVFLILLICRETIGLLEGVRLWPLVRLIASILLVSQFRDYILLPVTVPAALCFLVRGRAHLGRNLAVGFLVAAAVIYTDRAFGSARLRSVDLETFQEIRRGTAEGASQFDPNADISTPTKALVFLPKGLAYFLLAPFPWQLAGLRQALTLPEMLFLYSLVPSIVRGIIRLARDHGPPALLVLLVSAGLTMGYALGQANTGTAYRHRAQVLPFFLIYAAVGATRQGLGPRLVRDGAVG